jgi:hypothetical protein
MDTFQPEDAVAHTLLQPEALLEQFATTEMASQQLRLVVAGETKRGIGKVLRICVKAYSASLIGTFVILPIIVSVVTAGIYVALAYRYQSQQNPDPGSYAILLGAACVFLAWLVIAIPFCYFTTATGANTCSYGLLSSRLRLLEAQLGMTGGTQDAETANTSPTSPGYNHKVIALEEAYTCYKNVYKSLYDSPAGLEWVLGMGYINAWIMLHRAEEALFEVQPDELVLRNAMHDKLSIEGSTISNREELLAKLVKAAKELKPEAATYFEAYNPDKSSGEIRELRQQVEQLTQAIKKQGSSAADTQSNVTIDQSAASTAEAVKVEAQIRARIALREVRRTLDEFRDKSWEGLVRARNNLLCAIALMGCVTHILLCIVILTIDPKSSISTILAATAFYMVGAIAGMFGRFYRESQVNTAIDDYGLSFVRMIATPLLSGLAGVGGVVITALLYSTLPGQQSVLQDIFQLKDPHFLLPAALFGLTPNLIIRSLEKSTGQYVEGLQSSKGSERTAVDAKE